MTIDLIRLLVDTGFLILIWAVQLVIYPSFCHYSNDNLIKWHRLYTVRVTVIVLPLMLGQLILSLYHLWCLQNWYTFLSFILVITLWLMTFLIFVPMHQSIDLGQPKPKVCNKLVSKNWMRTTLWTFLFIISIVNYLGI